MVLTEEEQRREFFDNLRKALGPLSHGEASTARTFAICKAIKYSERLILKSFHVEGAGEFQLPLSAGDLPQLRSVCQQASFENRLPSQGCWQVEAEKLSFPGTPTFLSDVIQGITQEAVCALGFDERGVKVQAHLHKLFLYEKGSHYTLHRDTEKVRGTFGTLILQLPTEEGYTGGSLVVQQQISDGQCDKKRFDCHLVSEVGFCYTVLFRDCLHKLRKVESGTRVCLVFNLVQSDLPLDPAYTERISSKVQEVQAALQPWLEEATRTRCGTFGAKLAFPLQHIYSQENLCFAWLKGDDMILAEVLQNCRDNNNEAWLDLHLCLVTEHVSRSMLMDHHSGYLKFKNWIGPHDTNPSIDCGSLCIDLGKEIVVGDEGTGPFDSNPNNLDDKDDWDDSAMLVVWPRLLSFAVASEAKFSRALYDLEKTGEVSGANFSRALDDLENTVEVSGQNFCGQLRQVLCFCERVLYRISTWGIHSKATEDPTTTRLLNLCLRATALEVVQILKLLAKPARSYSGETWSYSGEIDDTRCHIGVRGVEVATAIAVVVEVFGWELVCSHVIDLTRKCALTQSKSLVTLAKQMQIKGNTLAGSMVVYTTLDVIQTRIGELESHERYSPLFSWCQPDARLAHYPDIENFLKGPKQKMKKTGFFQGIGEARSFAENFSGRFTAGYSALATPGDIGWGAFCEIRKTKGVFEHERNAWIDIQIEKHRLTLVQRELESDVQELYAFNDSNSTT